MAHQAQRNCQATDGILAILSVKVHLTEMRLKQAGIPFEPSPALSRSSNSTEEAIRRIETPGADEEDNSENELIISQPKEYNERSRRTRTWALPPMRMPR